MKAKDKKSMFCRVPCPMPNCAGVCNRTKGHLGLHKCSAGHTWAGIGPAKRCGQLCPKCYSACKLWQGHVAPHNCGKHTW
jgi:hypothetical protein